MPTLQRATRTLHLSHKQATKYILTHRPRGPDGGAAANAFWSYPKHRAILLYAVLTRPGTITSIEETLQLGTSKLYKHFRVWGIDYLCFTPAPTITATGMNQRFVSGRLTSSGDTYLMRTTTRTLRVKYTPWGAWQIQNDPGPDVPLEAVITAIQRNPLPTPPGITPTRHTPPGTLKKQLSALSRIITGHPIIPHPRTPLIEAPRYLVPRIVIETIYGLDILQDALALSNACRCVFWDDENSRCGIGSKIPKEKDSPCPDRYPLQEETHGSNYSSLPPHRVPHMQSQTPQAPRTRSMDVPRMPANTHHTRS